MAAIAREGSGALMSFNAPPNVQLMLNQQFMQGCSLVQLAVVSEASGNLPAANQCFQQGAGLIGNSIQTARQWGMPVADPVFFSCAWAHFGAARVGWTMGLWRDAPMHLVQALGALNQAISINPNVFYYHSAAGTALLAQGNLIEADREFNTALRLNPGDPWSQYMLAVLQTAQGNTTLGHRHYSAARTAAPGLPPVQQMLPRNVGAPEVGPGAGAQPRWLEILANVGTIADVMNKIGVAANTWSGLMGQFQQGAGMGSNFGGSGWGW